MGPLNPRIPFKRLTPEEMATRRDKGLCYQCDDKWTPGHHCRLRLYSLITDDDFDVLDQGALPEPLRCNPPKEGPHHQSHG